MNWRSFAFRLLGVGFFVATVIVLFTLGGIWLGDKLGARLPVALGGLTLGTIIAMLSVYLMLRPLLKQKSNQKNNDGKES